MTDYMATSRIEFPKIMAMTFVYLGSQMTTLALSFLFGVSEETLLRCTKVVLEAIVDQISYLIFWPPRSDYPTIALEFNKIGNEILAENLVGLVVHLENAANFTWHFFPNVIGALDGCHLEIQLTEEKVDDICYSNYHQYNSIILLAIATYDLTFIDVNVGWPGRAHDQRVWRNSEMWYKLDDLLADGHRDLLNSYHIVADAAFSCRKHLMSPYINIFGQDMDRIRSNFNRSLSSKRQNVERAFVLLKQRFPRVEMLNQKSTEKKILIVLAACAMHNICIREQDKMECFLDEAERAVQIFWPNLPSFTENENRILGKYKRDLLARSFFTG